MKVYLFVDMEGMPGITEYSEIDPHSGTYAAARRWMTQHVNAAVEGALEAGATGVLINDSHGGGNNFLFEEMHPRARLLKGRSSRPLLKWPEVMTDVEGEFEAAFLLGYHARLLQPGIISHTFNYSAGFLDIRINGKSVSEGELDAAVAGVFGVPVVLGTGDDCFCREMAEWNPNAEAVAVKASLTWQDGIVRSLSEVNNLTREAAMRGVAKRKEIPPFAFDLPIRLEVECANTAIATSIAFMPRIERVDHRTIAFESSDYLEVLNAMRAAALLQLTALNSESTLPGKY